MKKTIKKLSVLALACAILAATICALLSLGTQKTYAAIYDAQYGFEYTSFHVNYDIRADRTMDVTYDLGVKYGGYSSTGILFDIPVNAGDRVRNVKAYELDSLGGNEKHLDYKVKNEEHNLVTVDMGDYSLKYLETHYYRIKFEYAITRPASNEKNAIYLNAIGFGHQADMTDVKVTINLPEGFIGSQTKCYTGYSGSDVQDNDFTVSGNTITLVREANRRENGVTFEMHFAEGVLSTKPDLTPYWIIIAACVIFAIIFALKFLVFNRDGLSPVTNVQAPDDMDPLVMGKLIDNKVDRSDVTSLIYYWADKGFLKIDLENENDITLIKTIRELPQGYPQHQRIMFGRMFMNGDMVKISSLTNKFYGTVETVTKNVNAENGKLYDGKSMGVAVLFAFIGALFMGITPLILAKLTIAPSFTILAPVFMIIPAFIIFALTQSVKYNSLKLKKSKKLLMYLGISALSLVFTAIYVIFVPSYVIEIVPKIILCVVGFAMVMLSANLISRTKAYTEKLNQIVGFRDFILSAEKDRLETMLEGNPEFYYHVLPYAIVLGVSDIWEQKFASLTVPPPSWTVRRYQYSAFDFIIFNSAMRRANMRMTTTFISRPAPSGGSFSGGGHGGGGSRGR